MRFRKGEKNDKDVFIEVWRDDERGFISSRKVTDKISKIYNDAIFGAASWSKDENKIVFIAEKADPASYKSYWEDQDPTKKPESESKDGEEGNQEEKKKEEAKEQFFQH